MARMKHSELKRAKPSRKPIRRFYLVTEGKNTEPEYFDALQRVFRNAQLKIVIESAAGDPSSITKKAISLAETCGLTPKRRKKLDSFEENDEVWAVFDRDEHVHYDVPKEQCRKRGIGVAYSDPCFEHWLNLHFDGADAPYGRVDAQKKLESLCGSYSRSAGKTADFDEVIKYIEIAENRAERQLDDREQEANVEGNPSTSVFRLTLAIKKAAAGSS